MSTATKNKISFLDKDDFQELKEQVDKADLNGFQIGELYRILHNKFERLVILSK